MISQDIRRRFLKYFQEKGHAIVPSSSVVPHDDPTLLFTNAGMNQFKDVFLGKSQRDYKRAATAQKCIRAGGKHNDLDNVGHTSRHMTFFEMLGNFSFGDYFKEQAIDYAWEVSTQVLEIDPKNLWITVFQEDDEALALWQKYMPTSRIVRMGEADNFWAMGDTGPCGPCSELYFDRGSKYGNASSMKEDPTGERYLEFWNLVFMQFNRDAAGKCTPLPRQSIDTGAGLERVVSLKMGVDTIFATDILSALIAQVEAVSGKSYNNNPAFHVIADHIRSLSFAIADGAQPSNVERGYVLRKILRRAVRYGRTLGFQEPFLAKILPRLIETMGMDYPELVSAEGRIAEILTLEEESFLRTLKRGGNILSSVIEKAKESPLKEIRGEEAFKLKDTYGFPLEEILLLAKDSGLQVNLDAFQMLEEQAKEKSRSAQTVHMQEAEENLFKDYVEKHGPCTFVGYTDMETEAKILAIVTGGKFVNMLSEGEEGMVILNQTPFYAEKGGQASDTGTLVHHKAHFIVNSCQSPYPDVIVHIGKLDQGALVVGEPLTARIDTKRRSLIAAHHTATHLLHWALQQVLGPHIKQAGSLVEPGRLRFDFNHHKPLSPEEIRAIENLVNEKIRENRHVEAYELSFADVQKRPDIKQFFGDKYGSRVRVIDIDFSKELCGGTHVGHLGTIGLFRIAKESSIAAGVRRIDAVTGKAAEELTQAQEDVATQASGLLKTTLAKLPEKIAELLEENKELAQKLKQLRRKELSQLANELSKKTATAGSIPLLAVEVSVEGEDLSLLADDLMQKVPSCVLVLAARQAERCQLLVRVSPDLVQKGVQAVALIKEIAPLVGGSGGGKENSAQAGGKQPDGIPAALEKAKTLLSKA
jgi:alanyl-tRNA synthetase